MKIEKEILKSIAPVIWEYDHPIMLKQSGKVRYYRCDCGANVFYPSAYNVGSLQKIYRCARCRKIKIGWAEKEGEK